ncbi:MAG: hypothetical protein ACRERU_19545 [Methylococcales bacterium]
MPKDLRLAGISDRTAANSYLREVYRPVFNKNFAQPAREAGSAFVPFPVVIWTTYGANSRSAQSAKTIVRALDVADQIVSGWHHRWTTDPDCDRAKAGTEIMLQSAPSHRKLIHCDLIDIRIGSLAWKQFRCNSEEAEGLCCDSQRPGLN